MAIRCWFLAAIAAVLGNPVAVGDPPSISDEEYPGNRHVKARLVLEETALTPGKGGHLGLIFDIEKGWHMYWRYAGDSGLPPKVEFKLPPGMTVGDAQWPAPVRHVEPGDMVDYIFEKQLVLIYPLTVSAAIPVGKPATVTAEVEWLVCSDKCVPGRAIVKSEFVVASPSRPSADAGLFAAARKLHPQSASASSLFTANWEGLELVLHAKGAKRLAYFPYENDEGIYPSNLYAQGVAKGEMLRLAYSEEVKGLAEVRGLLVMTRDGQDSYYEVKVAGPAGGSAVRTK